MKYILIVSAPCASCGKRGKTCVEIERQTICADCLRKLANTLDLIKRRVVTKEDLV